MSGEYVPTTDAVRHMYAQGYVGRVEYHEEGIYEFDRWLTAHDAAIRAEVRAEVAREIKAAGRPDQYRDHGTIEDARWAWELAARIAKGGKK